MIFHEDAHRAQICTCGHSMVHHVGYAFSPRVRTPMEGCILCTCSYYQFSHEDVPTLYRTSNRVADSIRAWMRGRDR